MMINLSYFGGILWYIYCDIYNEFFNHDYPDVKIELCAANAPEPDVGGQVPPTFVEIKKTLCNSEERNVITMTYFLFTTLSTTGFGDYAPRSNSERIVGS